MNNLKRVLSLGLASVMLAGTMAVGSSAADFTDAEKIQHKQAVDILVALGVVNGKEDGSYFAPQDNVTRGEMAKMIAVAMKGGNDVDTGVKATPSFTDIKGHWAESYIEYCYDLGVIAGRGDGTFDPNANVTAIEVTKMVLTALGYDAEAYKLKGSAWATRADELARNADPQLYEELAKVTLNVAATRDDAAQIIWNGLQNRTRQVKPSTNTNTGEVTWIYEEGNTMLNNRYGGIIFKGSFDGNYYTGAASEKGQIAVTGTYYYTNDAGKEVSSKTTARTIPSNLDIANIGEEVKVIFKDGTNSLYANRPDKNDVIYGVFVTGSTDVVSTTLNKIDGVDNKSRLKVNGAEYDLADSVEVITDYGVTSKTFEKNELICNSDESSALTRYLLGNSRETGKSDSKNGDKDARGDAIKVLFNDSNKIDRIYVTVTNMTVVTGVSSDKVTLKGIGTVEKKGNDIYSDVKKEDIVTVTTLYKKDATDDDAYTIVKKAESVTGKITGYKSEEKKGYTKDDTVSIDGTSYKLLEKDHNVLLSGSVPSDLSNDLKSLLDDEATITIYLVNGFVGAVQEVEATSNYAVVTQVNSGTSTKDVFDDVKIEVMDVNGVKTIMTLADTSKDVNKNKITSLDQDDEGNYPIKVGDIVTYSKTSNGKYEVIVKASSILEDAQAWYDSDKKTVYWTDNDGNDQKLVTAGDAVVFVQTDDGSDGFNGYDADVAADTTRENNKGTYKVYQIRNVKSMGSEDDVRSAVTVYEKDGKAVAIFLDNGKSARTSGKTTLYGIVDSVVGNVRIDGTQYVQYKISAGGESYTVSVKDTAGDPLSQRDIVYFQPNASGLYDDYDDIFAITTDKGADSGETATGYWVKEFKGVNDGIITIWTAIEQNADKSWVGVEGSEQTYALDDDVKIFYVDADNHVSTTDGSVDEFNGSEGYANVILIVDEDEKVTAIISEVGNERDLYMLGLSSAEKDGIRTQCAN